MWGSSGGGWGGEGVDEVEGWSRGVVWGSGAPGPGETPLDAVVVVGDDVVGVGVGEYTGVGGVVAEGVQSMMSVAPAGRTSPAPAASAALAAPASPVAECRVVADEELTEVEELLDVVLLLSSWHAQRH